ncbi:thiamine phosphate synthase [Carboxylicivirga linearis]|uniref:Thiamine-phosphate synthase n=1 Tax=Carboxylicivirga linearis TaxID=1628157 RepID=A0ABS5JZK9_9BACT|nr:thiamine phosphate synthase [Carboxylicivirga linearis]MBS2099924.1 thiamine phosphate synthase [Carboxylicivirga linearis]
MKTNIARLHFITSPSEKHNILSQIQQVVMGGGNWIQLRMKEEAEKEVEKTAVQALSFCMDNGAKLIINDRVELAARIGADGVHLGKEDMAPTEAREILGPQAVIGGTANTFEDIKRLVSQGVDYVGLGPFRFTGTKKKLSPVLGIEGYEQIIQQCEQNNIHIPIIAIGGLTPEDFNELFDAGIYGVALSSYINQQDQPGASTLELLKTIGKLSSSNWRRKH